MVSSETRCAWCCQVPASFAHLSCLRSLLISHNRFTHVPMELSALPALELLNANGNEIAMVDCVLPSVRRLLLDGNRLTTIPRGVLLCRRLQVKLTLLVQGLRRIRKILYSLRYAIAFSSRSYMCVWHSLLQHDVLHNRGLCHCKMSVRLYSVCHTPVSCRKS